LLGVLRKVLPALDEDLRIVVLMKYQKKMGCPEIAEALGRPQGTIRRWLSEAYEILAVAIERECKRRGYEL
jgi:RNA polymerase sigma factor (sigma-70 family)